jgi:hypothetical protein
MNLFINRYKRRILVRMLQLKMQLIDEQKILYGLKISVEWWQQCQKIKQIEYDIELLQSLLKPD